MTDTRSQTQAASSGTAPGNEPGTGLREVWIPRPASALRAVRVGELDGMPQEERWLIEELWSNQGVGFVAGQPKTGKTWLALELALAVASGKDALGRFAVPASGTVVVFPAEDDPRAARDRVHAMARTKGVDFDSLPLFVITEDALRIDETADRERLEALLTRIRPRLLVLDPLVRLHGGDENYAGHVAELLGYLRALGRRFALSIIVTHHVSKRGGRRGGEALRGSSDLHAWGDSNLYLERDREGRTVLSLEHRAAPAPDPLELRLESSEEGIVLTVQPLDAEEGEERPRGEKISRPKAPSRLRPQAPSLEERVLSELASASEPLSQVQLRSLLRVKNKRLTDLLRHLHARGLIHRHGPTTGWELVPPDIATEPPSTPPNPEAIPLSVLEELHENSTVRVQRDKDFDPARVGDICPELV